MLVYNLTIKVDRAIVDQWLVWQKEQNIPEIMSSGLFDDYKMYRLQDQDDYDGPTFIIQYFTSSAEQYKKYITRFAATLRQKAFDKWGNQFIAYSTIMEPVN